MLQVTLFVLSAFFLAWIVGHILNAVLDRLFGGQESSRTIKPGDALKFVNESTKPSAIHRSRVNQPIDPVG